MMKRLLAYAWLLGLVMMLMSCASTQTLPKLDTVSPMSDALWLHVHDDTHQQDSLLAVQVLADGRWRWVQTDAFGAPLARQIVDRHGWHNDGFLPPNHQASRLFAAMVPIVAQLRGVEAAAIYPHLTIERDGDALRYRAQQKTIFRIKTVSPTSWQMVLADGSQWQISVLEQ